MEEWRWIKGYEGLYQISSHGRLKSFRKKKDGYICSNVNQYGWYLTVNLFDESKKRKTKRIHILVAEAFIGEIPKGYHVHHKDGNKQNNHVENLEIIHPAEHSLESIKINPNCIKGMNNYNKYKKTRRIRQYTKDGHFIAEYVNGAVASRLSGVCERNILQVAGKTPFNDAGNYRKTAGGYKWVYADEDKGGDEN